MDKTTELKARLLDAEDAARTLGSTNQYMVGTLVKMFKLEEEGIESLEALFEKLKVFAPEDIEE